MRLARGDCRRRSAARLCCDQDIAADGFFSLGMIADFDASLDEHSARRSIAICSGNRASSGRCCTWKPKLPARARPASAVSMTIPSTTCSGSTDHAFQSLYHFTVGVPVEDPRLTTEPGYAWEAG